MLLKLHLKPVSRILVSNFKYDPDFCNLIYISSVVMENTFAVSRMQKSLLRDSCWNPHWIISAVDTIQKVCFTSFTSSLNYNTCKKIARYVSRRFHTHFCNKWLITWHRSNKFPVNSRGNVAVKKGNARTRPFQPFPFLFSISLLPSFLSFFRSFFAGRIKSLGGISGRRRKEETMIIVSPSSPERDEYGRLWKTTNHHQPAAGSFSWNNWASLNLSPRQNATNSTGNKLSWIVVGRGHGNSGRQVIPTNLFQC